MIYSRPALGRGGKDKRSWSQILFFFVYCSHKKRTKSRLFSEVAKRNVILRNGGLVKSGAWGSQQNLI